jgi:hypothetical protein
VIDWKRSKDGEWRFYVGEWRGHKVMLLDLGGGQVDIFFDPKNFQAGMLSAASIVDGKIMRLREEIGKPEEVTVTGHMSHPDFEDGAWARVFTDSLGGLFGRSAEAEPLPW